MDLENLKKALNKNIQARTNAENHTAVKFYLNVPYNQKDIAKQAGCKFDFTNKAWYFIEPTPEELALFKEFNWLFKETPLNKTRDEYMEKVKQNKQDKQKYSYQYEYKVEES